MGLDGVLFATHIDVTTAADHVQGRNGEDDKTSNQFPHVKFSRCPRKRPSTEGRA
jgi:hypothetical protein